MDKKNTFKEACERLDELNEITLIKYWPKHKFTCALTIFLGAHVFWFSWAYARIRCELLKCF